MFGRLRIEAVDPPPPLLLCELVPLRGGRSCTRSRDHNSSWRSAPSTLHQFSTSRTIVRSRSTSHRRMRDGARPVTDGSSARTYASNSAAAVGRLAAVLAEAEYAADRDYRL